MVSTDRIDSQANQIAARGAFSQSTFSDQVQSVASALGSISDRLARSEQTRLSNVARTAAATLTGIADYAVNVKVRNLPGDAARLARTNPLAFAVGAFAAGLVIVRMIKASDSDV